MVKLQNVSICLKKQQQQQKYQEQTNTHNS